MTSPTVHAPGPDSLAERLAEDMRRRWQGENENNSHSQPARKATPTRMQPRQRQQSPQSVGQQTRRSRNPEKKAPSTGPVERV